MTEHYVNRVLNIEAVVSCFDKRKSEHFYFAGEFHPFWEFVYVADGEITAAGDENVYHLTKGDIIFHKPMEFHRLWAVNGASCRIFVFAFRAEGSYLENFENGVFRLPCDIQNLLCGIMKYLSVHFYNPAGDYQDTMHAKWKEKQTEISVFVNMLEGFLLSVPLQSRLSKKETKPFEVPEIYRLIMTQLHANIYGWITLEQIADACNFSVSQIKRVFSQYSDTGIHKYFVKLKIAESIKLLDKGEKIGDISRKLAFSNQNYFSAVFKRETGCSPSEYKKGL